MHDVYSTEADTENVIVLARDLDESNNVILFWQLYIEVLLGIQNHES